MAEIFGGGSRNARNTSALPPPAPPPAPPPLPATGQPRLTPNKNAAHPAGAQAAPQASPYRLAPPMGNPANSPQLRPRISIRDIKRPVGAPNLEALMKATLGALANFNEDERMLLAKQFRREEEKARQMGEYSPPGLINIAQFRHAFKKFSVRVSEPQARALFIKYNCDSQGLMPYDMFVTKLLSSPARLMALEPEQRGAYKPGGDLLFKGRIIYKPCRKPVYPPSNWDGTPAQRSNTKPGPGLKLEFVYGYAGHNTTCNNLFWALDFRLVYHLAVVGIVYDSWAEARIRIQLRGSYKTCNNLFWALDFMLVYHLAIPGLKLEFVYGYAGHNTTCNNLFWTSDFRLVYHLAAGHDNDILALAIHPERNIVATGQMSNALAETGNNFPYVDIWDIRDVHTTLSRLTFPSEGAPARCIVALAFSGAGHRLVVVTGDNRHTVYVFDWRTKKILNEGVGYNGIPPQKILNEGVGYNGIPPQVYGAIWNNFLTEVYGAIWNNFLTEVNDLGENIIPPRQFITYGVKHLKIWTLGQEQRQGKTIESYSYLNAKFGKFGVNDVMSAIFISAVTVVTGTMQGEIVIWDLSGTRGIAAATKIVQAHSPGAKAPSLHNRQHVLQGLRGMCLRANNSELCTGGSDGTVICWDITSGHLGRVVKKIELAEAGQSSPISFRSLDSRAGSYDLIAGTGRCEIWEITKDVPEPLIQGHTGTVNGIAFHPKKPHKFATTCDSNNVNLWNGRRRQLIARVNLGVSSRGIAFSPNGAHLAVGCVTGAIKVLLVEELTEKVAEMHYAAETVDEMKYSPDGCKLAAGSHDNFIDIYDVTRGYQRLCRCYGHSSYITHLDWSIDSRMIQSNCGSYELLYFQASSGKQVVMNQRDAQFATWTCVLGFPVMGIWQKYTDGTDINAAARQKYSDGTDINAVARCASSWVSVMFVRRLFYLFPWLPVMGIWQKDTDCIDINAAARSNKKPEFAGEDPLAGLGEYVVTASDDNKVRIFNYPVVVTEAPHRAYVGHASHVLNIRFSPNNKWVVSLGGEDRGAFQWAVLPVAGDGLVVEKPDFSGHMVYKMPLRKEFALDPLIPMPLVLAPNEDRSAAIGEDDRRKAEAEAARLRALHIYEIVTITSDIKGAATNSAVFMVMYGTKKASGQVNLENGPDNFARGKVDTFGLSLPELGPITRIIIGHNEKGSMPRWHLETVTITDKTAGTQAQVFQCGQWFARDIDDGKVVRTLQAGSAPELKMRNYKEVLLPWSLWGTAAFMDELAAAINRCNYNQRNSQLNALAGLVSFLPAAAGSIWAIEGGNRRAASAMFKASGATLHKPCTVQAIHASEDGKFFLLTQCGDMKGHKACTVQAIHVSEDEDGKFLLLTRCGDLKELQGPFDSIIVAAPLELANITFSRPTPDSKASTDTVASQIFDQSDRGSIHASERTAHMEQYKTLCKWFRCEPSPQGVGSQPGGGGQEGAEVAGDHPTASDVPEREFQTTVTTYVRGTLQKGFFGVAPGESMPETVFLTEHADSPISSVALKYSGQEGHVYKVGGLQCEIEFQTTATTYVRGTLQKGFFGVAPGESMPETVFLTEHADSHISSVALKYSGEEGHVYKAFSQQPLEPNVLEQLFSAEYSVLSVDDWKAYPKFSPPERFAPFELAPGIFYNNAIENAASAMEMSVIVGVNSAILAAKHVNSKTHHAAAPSFMLRTVKEWRKMTVEEWRKTTEGN
eukprot:gene18393-24865_t